MACHVAYCQLLDYFEVLPWCKSYHSDLLVLLSQYWNIVCSTNIVLMHGPKISNWSFLPCLDTLYIYQNSFWFILVTPQELSRILLCYITYLNTLPLNAGNPIRGICGLNISSGNKLLSFLIQNMPIEWISNKYTFVIRLFFPIVPYEKQWNKFWFMFYHNNQK